MVLQPGQRITAPFPLAPAEAKNFQPRAGYFLLEVVLDDDHHTYKPLGITDDHRAQIQMQGNLHRGRWDNGIDHFEEPLEVARREVEG